MNVLKGIGLILLGAIGGLAVVAVLVMLFAAIANADVPVRDATLGEQDRRVSKPPPTYGSIIVTEMGGGAYASSGPGWCSNYEVSHTMDMLMQLRAREPVVDAVWPNRNTADRIIYMENYLTSQQECVMFREEFRRSRVR